LARWGKTDSLDTDAFGMNVASTGTTPTPFGFAGQHGYHNDSVTGLMRLGHRYYDASVGRFLSRDPIQDGYNWYAYCNNDPVNGFDPEGLMAMAAGFALLLVPEPSGATKVIGIIVLVVAGILTLWALSESDGSTPPTPPAPPAPAPPPTPPTWPTNPKDMDDLIGMPGQPVPDGPNTPGRNKIKWNPSDDIEIVYEQHPYHPTAPPFHKDPHWHLKTPGTPHARYLPGEPIPGF